MNQYMRCIAQWDVNRNRLINRYFEARLVGQNDNIQLEFQKEETTPPESDREWWQNPLRSGTPINVKIVGTQLQLIDSRSEKVIWTTQASKNILAVQISPDSKLLALALSGPEIELWGIEKTDQNSS